MRQLGMTLRKLEAALNIRRDVRRAASALVVCALAVSVTRAFEDQPAEPVGLAGILGTSVPDGLDEQSLSALGGNWETWSAGLAADVAKFYDNASLDVPAQREALNGLKKKLEVVRRALNDRAYRSLYEPLVAIQGRLSRRLAIAEAALDTLEQNPETVKQTGIDAGRKSVASAVAALREDLGSVAGGAAWLPYVRADQLSQLSNETEGEAALLEGVLTKIKNGPQLEDKAQAAFLSRPSFAKLGDAISGLLDAHNAEVKPVDTAALRENLTQLVGLLEKYESSGLITTAEEINDVLGTIGESALDGGARIKSAVDANYVGSNLQVAASEEFLSKLVYERRQSSDQIRDFIDGANVYGTSNTVTEVGIDTHPSRVGAKLDITLNGRVRSDSTGSTSQGSVRSVGNHSFIARKPLYTDGETVTAGPATISVNANNTPVGASTTYDGSWLFADTARERAMGIAYGRKGRSDALTRQRITEKALPQFNAEVDKQIPEMNRALREDFNLKLKDAGLYPKERKVQSTETHLWLTSRIMKDNQLGGDKPSTAFNSPHGVTIHVHESLLNNAFDKLAFAGRTMTQDEVKAELEKQFSDVLGREFKFDEEPSATEKPPEPGLKEEGDGAEEEEASDPAKTTFVFDATDPIRVQVDNGKISLILRTGLKREGKEDIPTHIITVPMTYRVEGDKIVVDRDRVRAGALQGSRNIAQEGVLRKRIESSIPSRTREATMNFEREGKSPIKLTITDIKAIDGWVTVIAQ